MKWIDHGSFIEICPPTEFNFEQCLVFLGRSKQEVLHQIIEGHLYKALKVNDETVLFKVGNTSNFLQVEFPLSTPSNRIRQEVAAYIWEMFDLDQDLTGFYELASQDKLLQKMVVNYYGLRMICLPDLFEAVTWAIMGQQINLPFAYTLKKRFVERYGESIHSEGRDFWVYPSFETIASLEVDDLRKLQFTVRKAEYIIGFAKSMANGELTKQDLLANQDEKQIQNALKAIRGIGPWTADYVRMKCLHHTSAFPIGDAGLHQAIKHQMRLDRKPTIAEIKEVEKNWEGWQAYATFYLWRSLYEQTA